MTNRESSRGEMMRLIEESLAMRIARRFGMDELAWSLRRFHCPVPKSALVLEVGSGGNPYVRANVLLDAYEDTRERHWVPLVRDRPTVLGFAENLPFRDQTFDFVIASHVLEHSARPERFLGELQRVARAGYIEVPDAFMERINPYHDHRLEITVRDGRLIIRKKPAWRADAQLVELYEHAAKRRVALELIPARPFDFHVRFYWSGRIDYEVINPDVDALWSPPVTDGHTLAATVGDSRAGIRKITRLLFSQQGRNQKIDLLPLLQCPVCGSAGFDRSNESLVCRECQRQFSLVRGIPDMTPAERHDS